MAERLAVCQRYSHEIYGGPRRWFWLTLHPDIDAYRRAAQRFRPDGGFAESYGCFHPPADTILFDDDGGEYWRRAPRGYAGVMRLVRGHTSTVVVSHETVHAALTIYRMDVEPEPSLGIDCGQQEETLAHIVGDLVGALSTAMHDLREWAPTPEEGQ